MNLEKYKKLFYGKATLKIKHETLCNDCIAAGLKNVSIPNEIIALPCSWIRRLYDNFFHEWNFIRYS